MCHDCRLAVLPLKDILQKRPLAGGDLQPHPFVFRRQAIRGRDNDETPWCGAGRGRNGYQDPFYFFRRCIRAADKQAYGLAGLQGYSLWKPDGRFNSGGYPTARYIEITRHLPAEQQDGAGDDDEEDAEIYPPDDWTHGFCEQGPHGGAANVWYWLRHYR